MLFSQKGHRRVALRKAAIVIGVLALSAILVYTALAAFSLTTMFATNNQNSGNMFDVQALGPAVTITALDLNLWSVHPNTVSVYYKPGTVVGYDQDPGPWTLLGTYTVIAAGSNNPAYADIDDLTIPAGETYGLYVHVHSPGTILYTNGGPSVFADDYLSITTYYGKGSTAFTSTTSYPRIWNGTIYYVLAETEPVVKGCDVGDGSLNANDCGRPVAIYPGSYEIWGIDPATGHGAFALELTDAEIAAAGIPADAPALLAEGVNPHTGAPIMVFRLPSGEFQLNTFYVGGKPYVVKWNAGDTFVTYLAW